MKITAQTKILILILMLMHQENMEEPLWKMEFDMQQWCSKKVFMVVNFMEIKCLVHYLSSMQDTNPCGQRGKIPGLNDRVLSLVRKPNISVRQVSSRTVGSSDTTSLLFMYSLNACWWRIFRNLTHGWIYTVTPASQALMGWWFSRRRICMVPS